MKLTVIVVSILLLCPLSVCGQHDNIKLAIKDFSAGALSSGGAMVVYAPFHYFQNRKIQTLTIDRNPLTWFRGAPALAIGKAPTMALQMSSYGIITRIIQNNQDLSSSQDTVAATIAGGLSGIVSNSTHLIALHQENKGSAFVPTIKQLPLGIYSLSRGLGTTVSREMLFANIYLIMLKNLKTKAHHYINNTHLANIGSCLLSGVIIAGATQPFMVITAKLYNDIEKKLYTNGYDALCKTFLKFGISGFYRGSSYRCVGIILALPCFDYLQCFFKD